MTAGHIRAATAHDLDAMRAIYNHAIDTTTAVFHLDPVDAEAYAGMIAAKQRDGYPVLVAEENGTVVGFASYGGFRHQWNAYRYSVEHSVYVADAARRRGHARDLVRALIAHARSRGFHAMIGGIEASNAASLRLHAALGFEPVARFREVGYKFGRWLDLVFVERLLEDGAHDPGR